VLFIETENTKKSNVKIKTIISGKDARKGI
jgi:hypothetical protein